MNTVLALQNLAVVAAETEVPAVIMTSKSLYCTT
ncbi:class III lanthipeptide [Amycolatopsis sp. cg5]